MDRRGSEGGVVLHNAMPPRVALSQAETWAAMEALQDAGLARSLGVCNMTTGLLTDLCNAARRMPEVLQVEMHPHLTQEKLLRFARGAGIAVTAFSPLGAGSCECEGPSSRTQCAEPQLLGLCCFSPLRSLHQTYPSAWRSLQTRRSSLPSSNA